MKLIFTSYVSSPEYSQPEAWLKRIEGYTGILEALRHDHEVIGIERINYEGAYQQNGVQYYFIKQKKKLAHFPWRMHRMIKKLEPDVVFINGFIFPLQIIQLRLRLGKKIKIIILHRAEKPSSGYRKFLQCLAGHCINAYLFASDEMGMEWVHRGIIKDKNKIVEIMQASSVFHVEDKKVATAKTKIQGDPVFLWVGRLDDNKDPLTVVKAFGEFVKYQPAATLYMIYQEEGLLEKVRALVSLNDKGFESIRLVGKVPHDELQAWYNSADFIISGSHYEGSGVAVCEAMSCGCIPVITNIKSFSRMTGPAKCGLLYEPGNDKDLLAALLKTREMDIEKERTKVLQQFKQELSFDAIAKKINKVIATI